MERDMSLSSKLSEENIEDIQYYIYSRRKELMVSEDFCKMVNLIDDEQYEFTISRLVDIKVVLYYDNEFKHVHNYFHIDFDKFEKDSEVIKEKNLFLNNKSEFEKSMDNFCDKNHLTRDYVLNMVKDYYDQKHDS
jgi:hypothetical protein